MFRVDGETDATSQITSEAFSDFAVGATGHLYGLTGDSVREIDPQTGTSTELTAGGLLVDPVAVTVGQDGYVYVLDSGSGGSGVASVVRVDPVGGGQSIVTTGGSNWGVREAGFADMSLSPDGNLIILGEGISNGGIRGSLSELLSVNPGTGFQSLITRLVEFTGGYDDTGIGVGPDGGIYDANFAQCNCVTRIDPNPWNVAVDSHGRLLVVDTSGRLLVVDSLYDFTELAQLDGSREVEVVPIPEPSTSLLLALGLAGLTVRPRVGR